MGFSKSLLVYALCFFSYGLKMFGCMCEDGKKRKIEKKVTFNEIVDIRYFEKDDEQKYQTVFWDHRVGEILLKNSVYMVYFSFNESKIKYPITELCRYQSGIVERRSEDCSIIKKVIKVENVTLPYDEKIWLLRIAGNKYTR